MCLPDRGCSEAAAERSIGSEEGERTAGGAGACGTNTFRRRIFLTAAAAGASALSSASEECSSTAATTAAVIVKVRRNII